MPRTPSTPTPRRAMPADDQPVAQPDIVGRGSLPTFRRRMLRSGLAALAVSALGLGVAGAAIGVGSAQTTATAPVVTSVTVGVPQPSAYARSADTSRTTERTPLDEKQVAALAEQRAAALARHEAQVTKAQSKASKERAKNLTEVEAAAKAKGGALAKEAGSGPAIAAAIGTDTSKSCLPVKGRYRVAARFGDVGAWARYHTGFDFSAPVGTTLRAPATGIVTNAGPGPASGWAGTYVAIEYPDGTSSLMAHMSTVTVRVGQKVVGCETVGAVGMTGRTFGAHLHFEIYPAGVEPGDVYQAVNPDTWLGKHGLRP